MIRDRRPVLDQVKSGLTIAGVLVVVCASLLVLWSFFPIYRVEAWAWHWKHGNNVQAGDLRVPVPNDWLVQGFETGRTQEIQLVNAAGGRPSWATISISVEQPARNMALTDFASSERRMMENLGIHVIDTRQLVIDGLSGFCLDGETAMAGLPVRNISCRLGSNFSIQYIGGTLNAPTFYSIVNGISKASKG